MKKLPITVLSALLLFTISCKDEKIDDMAEECNCCVGDCYDGPGLDPGIYLEGIVTGAPTLVKLNNEVRDEWSALEIQVTYNGTDGGTITLDSIPVGGEVVWFSSSYTLNAEQSAFMMEDGVERLFGANNKKVSIYFNIAASSRSASFEGDWEFVWGE